MTSFLILKIRVLMYHAYRFSWKTKKWPQACGRTSGTPNIGHPYIVLNRADPYYWRRLYHFRKIRRASRSPWPYEFTLKGMPKEAKSCQNETQEAGCKDRHQKPQEIQKTRKNALQRVIAIADRIKAGSRLPWEGGREEGCTYWVSYTPWAKGQTNLFEKLCW